MTIRKESEVKASSITKVLFYEIKTTTYLAKKRHLHSLEEVSVGWL
jgi:hypothetical protein